MTSRRSSKNKPRPLNARQRADAKVLDMQPTAGETTAELATRLFSAHIEELSTGALSDLNPRGFIFECLPLRDRQRWMKTARKKIAALAKAAT